MLKRVLVRFPARLPRSLLQPKHGLNPKSSIILPSRTYATPGRPKSVVGEPSRPVKRDPKKPAAKARGGSNSAEKTLASKKHTQKRAPTPEQIAAIKQKLADQKEARATRRAAQRAAGKASREKDKLRELKKAALDPPKHRATTNAFITFFTEKATGHMVGENSKIAEKTKAIAAEWKNVSAADREHYNHLTRTMNEEQQAAFRRWVESHTPDQIQKANEARAKLRKKLPSQKNKWAKISDERTPKKPASSFALFNVNRRSSGDFQGIKLGDAAKLIAQEWKALGSSEKEKYDQMYKDDHQRYVAEYTTVLGYPPFKVGTDKANAAA